MVTTNSPRKTGESRTVLAYGYDSEGALLSKVWLAANGKTMTMYLPFTVQTIAAGDWVAIYKKGEAMDVQKIELRSVKGAKFLRVHKLSSPRPGLYRTQALDLAHALGINGKAKVQIEVDGGTHSLLLRRASGESGYEQRATNAAILTTKGALLIKRKAVGKELDGSDYVAAYQQGKKVVLVSVPLHARGETLTGVSKVSLNPHGYKLHVTKGSESIALKSGDHVKILETANGISVIKEKAVEGREIASVMESTNNSNKFFYLPKDVVKDLDLTAGSWVKSRARKDGSLEIVKLRTPDEHGTMFLRVSRITYNGRATDNPVFIVPKRAATALGLVPDDAVSLYRAGNGNLVIAKERDVDVLEHAAQRSNLLLLNDGRTIGVEIPYDLSFEGFGIGEYVFATIDLEGRSITLQNAGLDVGEVPGKVIIAGDEFRMSIQRRLTKLPVGNFVLLRTDKASNQKSQSVIPS